MLFFLHKILVIINDEIRYKDINWLYYIELNEIDFNVSMVTFVTLSYIDSLIWKKKYCNLINCMYVEFRIFYYKIPQNPDLWTTVKGSKSLKVLKNTFFSHGNSNFHVTSPSCLDCFVIQRTRSFQDWCHFASTCVQKLKGLYQKCFISRFFTKLSTNYFF